MFNFFKKKPAPKPPNPPKPPKPQRIAVHLPDGTTAVHYAAYRTIHKDGFLSLHDNQGGGQAVADYTPGAWVSLSNGTRKLS